MRKTEIAARVFAQVSSDELKDLEGGPVVVPVEDLPGLMLVPWFCDGSIQWSIRFTAAASAFKKTSLKKARAATVTITETGATLIGVPGDGIRPYLTSTFLPLGEALATALESGTVLELATANLGVVKLDEGTFKAESVSRRGNQRYLGVIDPNRNWAIQKSTLPLSAGTLERALECGRMVARNGPWRVEDKSEAFQVLMRWMESKQANINPMAVKHFIKFTESAFVDTGIGPDHLCGLGLGFFHHRLTGTCFLWEPPNPAYAKSVKPQGVPGLPRQESAEEVARAILEM
jgi:hypothetical protein